MDLGWGGLVFSCLILCLIQFVKLDKYKNSPIDHYSLTKVALYAAIKHKYFVQSETADFVWTTTERPSGETTISCGHAKLEIAGINQSWCSNLGILAGLEKAFIPIFVSGSIN